MGYYHWSPMMHNGFGFFGTLAVVAFWVLLFVLVLALFKRGGHSENGSSSKALDILKERYAKGELSKKEFDEMKKEIS
ncbi:MAG: hypothetical protein UT39_C0006G0056 [Candidatus Woesebacteria bacterium GW2011_GWA1_39_21]|uniref:SHOCT domain-containing protein n=1 Tax=Candidatus Woesebacteria bacterium GW2011_GWA1_39_21 TaxID=1618550 RepID=A0A0G0QMD4_9BACT|nr:MAG: hypothetical protein UT39_C0006G0056 [Candidatus Woesebacteria bacterium GW2011_GWA1_39_21]